jgi:mono/diheme cytochrome c family protein
MSALSVACLASTALLIAIAPLVHAQARSTPTPSSPGDAARGQRLYVANGCYACHNYDGSGGRQGPRLSQTRLTAQAFVAYVRRPRTMPAYGPKVMSDQQLTDVWTYIRTFPEPPAVSSLPLLKDD